MSKDMESPEASAFHSEAQATWYNSLLQQVPIYGIAAGYCISASLLSIINKWAVMKFPYPGALTALQYLISAAGVFHCGWFKVIEHDSLDLLTMWRFPPVAIVFYLSIFTNSELLLHMAPSLVASVLYVLTDYQFTLTAYTWAVAYLALLLFPFELLIMGELKKIKREISDESVWYSFQVIFPVSLSCLFGLAISFFGFSCRRTISATGFTVLGIVNKLLTVVINLVIWDKHFTFVGTVGLLICMLGGIMYQQSTSNKPKAFNEATVREREEEQQKLLEMQSNTEGNNNEKEVIDIEEK